MSAVTTSALEQAMTELTPLIGRRAACAAVGLPRATSYRRHPVRAARPPVVPAQLLNEAGIIGAALAARSLVPVSA